MFFLITLAVRAFHLLRYNITGLLQIQWNKSNTLWGCTLPPRTNFFLIPLLLSTLIFLHGLRYRMTFINFYCTTLDLVYNL